MTKHPPGLVGILSGDLTRYATSQQSMLALAGCLPAGSSIEWVQGEWIAVALNLLVDAMQPEHQWLCIVPDDHEHAADIILRLLDHNLPLVAPLCAMRRKGFAPSLFHTTEHGFQQYTWQELDGKTGLIPVHTFGGAFAVVRREVIEAVGQPFYQNMPGSRVAPQEDLYCYERCRQAGYQPMVDLDLFLGHCVINVLYPHRDAHGRYGVRVEYQGDPLVYLRPAPIKTAAETYHTYT